MACTTLLVGRRASFDGSTIIARNEDSPNGVFEPKRLAVVLPAEQPRTYRATASHLIIGLPDDPLRYSSVPDALGEHGVWAAAGVNARNVAMTATETITSNPRVLGADPLVEAVPAVGDEGRPGYEPAAPGGLGEEDFVTVVLPYVSTAREGVQRLGSLLEQHGTYEMNGVAVSDADEIWWLETIGGHHWIARRVPDDAYVTMPNQLGIDSFDLADAEGPMREHMASADLRAWMGAHHLDLALSTAGSPGPTGFTAADAAASHPCPSVSDVFDSRAAFGSHTDRDHVYNTPRAWYMQRCLNPSDTWEGPGATFGPESDDIPWARTPERKLTIEDVKQVLSAHYQGTPFDPYSSRGSEATRGRYRPIGINRNSHLAVLQLRSDVRPELSAIQWMAFGSNTFNALVPLYANVGRMPGYLSNTTGRVTTESFYWVNRIIAALADARFPTSSPLIEPYQDKIAARGHAMLAATDALGAEADPDGLTALLEQANADMVDILEHETDELLAAVLDAVSLTMRNGFARSDG